MKNRIIIPIILFILLLSNTDLFAGYYEEACKFYVYKKYEKAKELFLKIVEKRDHGDSYYFLGEIEKIKGNYNEAEKFYLSSIEIKTTTRKYKKNAYWNLIVFSEQRQDYSNVVKLCKKMWEDLKEHSAKKKIETMINKYLWTDNKEAIQKYNEGITYKRKKNKEKAASLFREAAHMDYNFLAPKFELGMMAYNVGDVSSASGYLSEIAVRIPFYSEVHLILGNIQYKKKYFYIAIEHFSKALLYGMISKKTEYIIKLQRGTCYYNNNEFDKAMADLEDALKIRKTIKPLLLLSAIQIKQGLYDDALSTLRKANKLSPDNPSILFQIGSIYFKKEDRKYLSYFDRLFDLTKKGKDPMKYKKVITILVNTHYQKQSYQRVLEIMSYFTDNMIDYDYTILKAKTYYYLKRYDNSADTFEKLSLNSDDKFMLCQAYARSGRKEKAKIILLSLIYYDKYLELAKNDRYLSIIINRIENDKKLEEQRRLEEQKKLEEERRLAEEKRIADEEKRLAEQKRLEEQRRLEQENKTDSSSSGYSDNKSDSINIKNNNIENGAY